MVRLQKCCCCSLRTGTLVIGYLKICLILLAIIAVIVLLSLNNAQMDKKLTVVVTVSLSVFFLALLINGLMVYGAHNGRPGFLFAWLAFNFLGLLLNTVIIVMTCGHLLSTNQDGVTYFQIFVVNPLLLVLAWYLYLVVYSYYRELRDGPSHGHLCDDTVN